MYVSYNYRFNSIFIYISVYDQTMNINRTEIAKEAFKLIPGISLGLLWQLK